MTTERPPHSSGAIRTFITRIAPFLLPGILFQSTLLAFLSPLPLFILTLRNRSWVSLLALFTNASFVYSMSGKSEAIPAALYWLMIGVAFPLLIRKLGKIQLSFVISFAAFVCILLAGLAVLSHDVGMDIITYVKTQVSLAVDHVAALPESPLKPVIEEQGRDTLLKQVYTELPSGVLITLILGYWINLLFASTFVRGFLSKSFWANYRNPEWLVWPTLLSAGLFAFGEHALYYFGLNIFKVLLVFYGFQGLSILSFWLNRYKIAGLGRILLFTFAAFIVMPLVLSIGFFDLWFDFRKKFGQS